MTFLISITGLTVIIGMKLIIYICHEISMLKILTQDVRTFMTFITIIILKEEKIGQSGYIGISWK